MYISVSGRWPRRHCGEISPRVVGVVPLGPLDVPQQFVHGDIGPGPVVVQPVRVDDLCPAVHVEGGPVCPVAGGWRGGTVVSVETKK